MEFLGNRGKDNYLPHAFGHEASGKVIGVGNKVKKVSIKDPAREEYKGAMYHTLLFLNLSKIFTSINCATRKAVPDPIAILIDIRSEKFVEINNVNAIPVAKPK